MTLIQMIIIAFIFYFLGWARCGMQIRSAG